MGCGTRPRCAQPQVDVEHGEGEAARRQEEERPGDQLPGEDHLVADLLEPPPVGEKSAQDGKEQEGDCGQDDDEQQVLRGTAPSSGRQYERRWGKATAPRRIGGWADAAVTRIGDRIRLTPAASSGLLTYPVRAVLRPSAAH